MGLRAPPAFGLLAKTEDGADRLLASHVQDRQRLEAVHGVRSAIKVCRQCRVNGYRYMLLTIP